MRQYSKVVLATFCFLLIVFLCSCSKSTKPNDVSTANVLAREGFDLMNEEAERLSHLDNISSQDDFMLESKFNEIEAKFDQALDEDADNPMAHLGISILEILRINYNPEFWSLIEDMQDMGNQKQTLLNRQFQFLANSSMLLLKNYSAGSKEAVSIARLQDFIHESVVPRLTSCMNHLDYAVNMADTTGIFIDTGEELIEIDKGEVYAFRASVHILEATFFMLTAYNWDMVGTDGTYNWIQQLNQNFAPVDFVGGYEPYDYEVVDGVLNIYYWDYWDEMDYSEPFQMEVAAKTFRHNLEDATTFGTLNQSRLTHARQSILDAADDISNCVNSVQNETDDQSNDVIKLQYIIDLEDEIANQDPDNPDFMQNWNDIDDVVTWLEGIVSGGSITVDAGDGMDVTISIAAYFNGGVSDIRNVIPYFHWSAPADSWLEMFESGSSSWPATSYTFWFDGEYVTVSGISQVREVEQRYELRPGYFTDSGGSQLGEDEFPHFPDYTFGGIFPGMTRAKLMELLDL